MTALSPTAQRAVDGGVRPGLFLAAVDVSDPLVELPDLDAAVHDPLPALLAVVLSC